MSLRSNTSYATSFLVLCFSELQQHRLDSLPNVSTSGAPSLYNIIIIMCYICNMYQYTLDSTFLELVYGCISNVLLSLSYTFPCIGTYIYTYILMPRELSVCVCNTNLQRNEKKEEMNEFFLYEYEQSLFVVFVNSFCS